MDPRYNERGEEQPRRFWLYRRHASPLALERGPAPSFLSSSSSPRLSPLFYIPPRPFFFREAVVNSSSRTNFGGDARRCDRTRRGMAAILFASATRLHCVTSSFIPDFAVDLRSEFTKTVTPVQTVRFPPFSLPDSLARSSLFHCSSPSLRNHHCPLIVSRKHLPVCENLA